MNNQLLKMNDRQRAEAIYQRAYKDAYDSAKKAMTRMLRRNPQLIEQLKKVKF